MMTREDMIAEAKRLYANGFSIRAIVQKLESPSRMTVWRWVNGMHDGSGVVSKKSSEGQLMKLPKVEGDGPIYPDIDPEDKDTLIARLRLENDILRGVNEILKVTSLRNLDNSQKTSLIDHLRRTTCHPLKELTAFLKISKSSYEYQHKVHMRPEKYAYLRPIVKDIFMTEGNAARGYRFIVDELRKQANPICVSEKVILRIMREEDLIPLWMKKKRKPYSSYKGEVDRAPKNLVKRDFRSALPNMLWLTDITEFKLPCNAKVYLSALRDCFDSSIVSWRIGQHPTAKLANDMLEEACAQLEPGEHPVIHSDRGGHYRWTHWKSICKRYCLIRSMSAKGCSPDNSAMEGFFGLLKKEFFHGRDWNQVGVDEFIAKLDTWIKEYNGSRRSEALGFITPLEFRTTLGRIA